MPYVIKVMDASSPGRIGWVGQGSKCEGPVPNGIRPFASRGLAESFAAALGLRFPAADIKVLEIVKKGARK